MYAKCLIGCQWQVCESCRLEQDKKNKDENTVLQMKGKKKSRLANNANRRWFCIFLLQSLSRSWSWAALTPADSGIWGTEQDAEAQMSQGQFGAKQEQVFRLLVTSSCLRAKVLCFPVLTTELFSSAAEFWLHSNNLWTHMLIFVDLKFQKNSQLLHLQLSLILVSFQLFLLFLYFKRMAAWWRNILTKQPP